MNVVTAEERKNEAEQGFGSLQEEQQDIDRKVAEIHADKEKTLNDLKTSEENEKILDGLRRIRIDRCRSAFVQFQ